MVNPPGRIRPTPSRQTSDATLLEFRNSSISYSKQRVLFLAVDVVSSVAVFWCHGRLDTHHTRLSGGYALPV